MPRPRLPSNVLNLRTRMLKKNPSRRRSPDLQGNKPLRKDPPPDLPTHMRSIWYEIRPLLVESVVYDCDALMLEMTVRALWALRNADNDVERRLCQKQAYELLGQFGMSPLARTRIPGASTNPDSNAFRDC